MNVVDIKDLNYHLLKNEDNHSVVKAVGKIWRKEKEDFKGMEVSKAAARVIAILTERYDILDLVKGDKETMAMWSFWQDIENSGFQKGEERGMERGMKKGKIDTLKKNVKTMLVYLFGNLTPELTKKIEDSDEERLDNVILHIFEIHNETDVYKILQ